jgi:hypothetical protein
MKMKKARLSLDLESFREVVDITAPQAPTEEVVQELLERRQATQKKVQDNIEKAQNRQKTQYDSANDRSVNLYACDEAQHATKDKEVWQRPGHVALSLRCN